MDVCVVDAVEEVDEVLELVEVVVVLVVVVQALGYPSGHPSLNLRLSTYREPPTLAVS